MTSIKSDHRVYKRAVPAPAPAPEKEKPVAKEAAPKAPARSKAAGTKRRKA